MALIQIAPNRSTRQADSAIIARCGQTKSAPISLKGGKGIMSAISSASAIVTMKLGKYADDYIVLRDDASVIAYFDKIIENTEGAIDTETTSLDPINCTIAGVCLYTPAMKPAYIPINHVSHITNVPLSNQVSAELVGAQIIRAGKALVKWIMHTANYDVRVIKHQLGVPILCYWDVYIGARLLNENEPAGLKDWHIKYCDSKDTEALSFEKLFAGIPFTLVPISIAYLYAAGDGLKTYEVYQYQKQFLNRRTLPGVFHVFMNLEMPLIPVVTEMEDAGIAYDEEFGKYLSDKYNAMLIERAEAFYKVASMYQKELDAYKTSHPNHILDDPILITSPDQIAVLLYDVLGYKSPEKDKPRGTGEDILLKLDVPLSKAILDYRETSKLLTTYVDKMPKILDPNTGRIHCKFNQVGAGTGRFSSSEPNMQNIPSHNKEIRKMFKATDGYCFISCDLSQQEPRTLAHVSQDPNLIQAYIDGKDIYAWIASSIYNIDYDECKEKHVDGTDNPEGKKRRDSVKSIILGIMYGRGAKAISEQVGCTVKEAQAIVDKFFKAYPKVKDFIDGTIAAAKQMGYVETVWGRKRRLPDMMLDEFEFILEGGPQNFDPLAFDAQELSYEVDEVTKRRLTASLKSARSWKEKENIKIQARQQGIKIKDNGGFIAEASRQCVNSIIQGSSADMIKKAMIMIGNDQQLRDWGFRLILQVHDELIGEAPDAVAKVCADRVSALMVEAAAERITVPMRCDAEITKCWYGEVVA